MAGRDLQYASIVNQKLAFARHQLKAAAAQDATDINARLARHAHLDAAVLQLVDGLAYFVAELGEGYKLALKPNGSLVDLLGAFDGRQSAAVAELRSLLNDRHSWLSGLMEARSDPLALPRRFSEKPEKAAAATIPLVDLERQGSADALSLLASWLQAAQAFIDRQRAVLQEY